MVADTDGDAWTMPSPCAGWSVLDVLGHVGEATAMGVRILRGGDLSFTRHDPPSTVVADDPRQWWKGLAAEARDALSGVDEAMLDNEIDSPMGRRSIREGLSFPAVDLFVHAWDMAMAIGRSVSFPDEVSRRPGVFASAHPAPDNATRTEELMPGRVATRAGIARCERCYEASIAVLHG